MPAQPQPVNMPLMGGIDEKIDGTLAERPQRIENARYAKTGALSKRNGYQRVEEYDLPEPTHETFDGYVAFDGDKFFARKTTRGAVDFFQRRDQDEYAPDAECFRIGGTGRMHPELTSLPGQRGPAPGDGLLCDIAYSTYPERIGPVILYVRLEMRDVDSATGITTYQIIVDYLDPNNDRLVMRQPTILTTVTYLPDTHQQIRAVVSGTPSRLWVVFSADKDGHKGIFAQSLDWGIDPTFDVIGLTQAVVNETTTNPYYGNRNGAGFDVAPLDTRFFSVLYQGPSPYWAINWARVSAGFVVENYIVTKDSTDLATFVRSLSISTMGSEHVFAYTATQSDAVGSPIMRGWVGRFHAPPAAGVAPTAVGATPIYDVFSDEVIPHSSVTAALTYFSGVSTSNQLFAGINTGRGFLWCTGVPTNPFLYSGVNGIACAWATGRPAVYYQDYGTFAAVVVPLVARGGELGGGAGLLAFLTPDSNANAGIPTYGAKLLATYAIDQIALDTALVSTDYYIVATTPHTGPENAALAIAPNKGSSAGPNTDPRWLIATGKPAAPVMLSLDMPLVDDFEFLEPGVMLMGPGVPVMCDALLGVSELGFHSSPTVMYSGANNAAGAGKGYAAGSIIQYRFQYRFIDGMGRAQVSPISRPYQMTAPLNETYYDFFIAPYDCTVRTHPVLIDVYRTDDKTADFCWIATITAQGGTRYAFFHDTGPTDFPRDETNSPNVENYYMTPPCASHAFKGSFRDVLITREGELWPSKRRLATTPPQFDIVDAATWDAVEPVTAGGDIDGKLILFSSSKIAYTYEQGGGLAPFTDIPSDTGALDGSRAVSTHLGVFYQSSAGIRLIGRDIAIHEVGQMVAGTLGVQRIRGGIKVPALGEVRLRLSDGQTYLVFDYLHGGPDQPVWYVYRYDAELATRTRVDEKLSPEGRVLFLCTLGEVLYETPGRYVDEIQYVTMRVLSAPMRGQTPLSYLATIEAAVNLELPPLAVPLGVRLSLVADYRDSRPSAAIVTKEWDPVTIESFDRRQLQISAGEIASNAPAIALAYEDVPPVPPADPEAGPTEGFGYRLSAMVMVYSPRDPKTLFPVANGARK